jgi:CBS domain-containing protein
MLGQHSIGSVLVCSEGRVVGIITERDCTREVLWNRRFTEDSPVTDLMRSTVLTVAPRDSIQHCMRVMSDNHVRYLPVLEDGRLVGLISMGDVITTLLSDQRHMIESLEQYIVGSPSLQPPSH